ncbi:InlB B-repeat-containing protein [Fibrobacter sp.]|uniref:InlB B-repeat-containing protein n=1 Tax=Fibrobacter sp. TaxID=35828 RepID=UPI00388DF6ED
MIKRLSLFIVSILAMAVGSSAALTTTNGCYNVGSRDQLLEFAQVVNGTNSSAEPRACANITADITYNSDVLLSNGELNTKSVFLSWTPLKNFAGTIHGGGHVIKGLYINSKADSVGFISNITGDVTIDSLGIEDSYISGDYYAGTFVGAISSGASLNIKDSHNSGTVYALSSDAGGFVGRVDGTLSAENCFNRGNVSAEQFYVAGFAGHIENGNITLVNCYNTGSMQSNEDAGGLLGSFYGMNDIEIVNCFNVGSVKAEGLVGGLIAEIYDGPDVINIKNSFNYGTVSATKGNSYKREIVYGTAASIEVSNVYYLADSDISGEVSKSSHATADEFANGTVAQNLQNAEGGNSWEWYDGDDYPKLNGNLPVFSVTLNLNGGSLSSSIDSYEFGEAVALPTPTKEGRTFVGWYEKEDFSDQGLTSIPAGSLGDRVYYARWQIVQNPTDGFYEIRTAQDLYEFAEIANGTHPIIKNGTHAPNAKLMNDVVVNQNVIDENGSLIGDLSSYRKWTPIQHFKGEFNGQNYTISGIVVVDDDSKTSYNGLFGILDGGVQIKNFGLEDSYISVTNEKSYSGTIAAYAGDYNWVRIENVYSTSTIECSSKCGGFVGLLNGAQGYAKNSYFAGRIISNNVSSDKIYPFIGIESGSFSVENSFYLDDDGKDCEEGDKGTIVEGTVGNKASTCAFVNGIVATKLNEGYEYWSQNVGVDKYPVLSVDLVKPAIRNIEYKVTLNAAGNPDEFENVASYRSGTGVTLPIVTYDGKPGIGWFDNPDYKGEPVTQISATDVGNKEFWTIDEFPVYSIAYDLNVGEGEEMDNSLNPTSYDINSENITLQDVERDGYDFLGWYIAETEKDTLVVSISPLLKRNFKLVARWSLHRDADGCYEIADADDLYQFAQTVNTYSVDQMNYDGNSHTDMGGEKDACAVLTDNIVVNETLFDENGDLVENTGDLKKWTPLTSFKGSFDGKGYTISGLYVDGGDSGAFIGSTGQNGPNDTRASISIKNLGIVNSYFGANKYAAVFVAMGANGSIYFENVFTDAKVVATNFAAGFVAQAYTLIVYITNSHFDGSVKSSGAAAGFAYQLINTLYLKNAYFVGEINGSENYIFAGAAKRIDAANVFVYGDNLPQVLINDDALIAPKSNNLFCLDDSEDGSTVGDPCVNDFGVKTSRSDFADGTVAIKFDQNRIDGVPSLWSQNVISGDPENSDEHPMLQFVGTPDINIQYKVALHYEAGAEFDGDILTFYKYGKTTTLPIAKFGGENSIGWYDNDFFAGSPITEISAENRGDIEFWTAAVFPEYTITYVLDGGENSSENPVAFNVKDDNFVLMPATREGREFVGWFTDRGFAPESKVDEFDVSKYRDVTLYALWSATKNSDGCYEIYTAADLYYFAEIVNGKDGNDPVPTACAKFEADVTINESVLDEYGSLKNDGVGLSAWTPLRDFAGVIDGNGHTLSGLYYNHPDENNVGFIGSVEAGTSGSPVVVKKLGILDSYFAGNQYVGSFVGSYNNNLVLANVYSLATVVGSDYIGGLIGARNKESAGDDMSFAYNNYFAGYVLQNGTAYSVAYGGIVFDGGTIVVEEDGVSPIGRELFLPREYFKSGVVAAILRRSVALFMEGCEGDVDENDMPIFPDFIDIENNPWGQKEGDEFPSFTNEFTVKNKIKYHYPDGTTIEKTYGSAESVVLPVIDVDDGASGHYVGWFDNEFYKGDPIKEFKAFDVNQSFTCSNVEKRFKEIMSFTDREFWTAPAFVLAFETNGGTAIDTVYFGIKEVEGMFDLESSVSTSIEGLDFVGWYSTPDFTGEVTGINLNDQKENVTLYAKWKLPMVNPDGQSDGECYEVRSTEALYFFADMANKASDGDGVLESCVSLTEDIEIPSDYKDWTPINNFQGKVFGNFHKIDGLHVNAPEQDYVGLFGSLSNAEVYKLGLTNVDITGRDYVGAFVGSSNSSYLMGCYSTGSVNGRSYVGGILGSFSGKPVGGEDETRLLEFSYNWSSVTGTGNNVGGLIGYLASSGNGLISSVYNIGSVSGKLFVGSLIGHRASSSIDLYEAYYLNGNVADVLGESTNEKDFTNGKVMYKLRAGSSSEDVFWTSDESNKYPVLTSEEPTGDDFKYRIYFHDVVNMDESYDGTTGLYYIEYEYHNECLDLPTLTDDDFVGWRLKNGGDLFAQYGCDLDNLGELHLYPVWASDNIDCRKIASADDLFNFADDVNSDGSIDKEECAVLTKDIVISEDDNRTWDPLQEYAGYIDGQGHFISGLRVAEDVEYAGLIGSVYTYPNDTVFVKNLTIKNSNFTATVYAGAVAAWVSRGSLEIENVALVDNEFKAPQVGGYIGQIFNGGASISEGSNESSSMLANTDANANNFTAGGFVGGVTPGLTLTISNSYLWNAQYDSDGKKNVAVAAFVADNNAGAGVSIEYSYSGNYWPFVIKGEYPTSDEPSIENVFALCDNADYCRTGEQFENGSFAVELHNTCSSLWGQNNKLNDHPVLSGRLELSYSLTLHLIKDDIETVTEQEYVYKPNAKTPFSITFDNCVAFDGWYDNENKEGNTVDSIPKASTGNLEYWGYAQNICLEIADKSGLQDFAQKASTDYKGFIVRLLNDIDWGNEDGTPNDWTPIEGFTGSFDGNGHVISGLSVENAENAGFFGKLGGDLFLANLGIENSSFEGSNTTGSFVGLGGRGILVIINSYSQATLHVSDGASVGGLIGSLDDEASLGIISAYYAGDFEASDEEHSCGGILGAADETNVFMSLAYYKNQESCVNSELEFGADPRAVEEFQNSLVRSYLVDYKKESLGKEFLNMFSLRNIVVNPSIWGQKVGFDDYPTFSGKLEYKVTFKNTTEAPVSYEPGVELTLPANPEPLVKDGIFAGWYRNETFSGSPVVSIKSSETGEKTFYAKWNYPSHTITYMNMHEDDVNSNPQTFTKVDEFEFVPAESAGGWEFLGWSLDSPLEEDNSNIVSSLDVGTDSNVVLYANWSAKSFKVTFEADYEDGDTEEGIYEFDQPVEFPDFPKYVVGHNIFNLLEFDCWSLKGVCVDVETVKVSGAQTFIAKYKKAESKLFVGRHAFNPNEKETISLGEGAGSASFDPATNTLTLTDADISSCLELDQNQAPCFGIYSTSDELLTVDIEGVNKVSSLGNYIFFAGDANFKGTGSFNVYLAMFFSSLGMVEGTLTAGFLAVQETLYAQGGSLNVRNSMQVGDISLGKKMYASLMMYDGQEPSNPQHTSEEVCLSQDEISWLDFGYAPSSGGLKTTAAAYFSEKGIFTLVDEDGSPLLDEYGYRYEEIYFVPGTTVELPTPENKRNGIVEREFYRWVDGNGNYVAMSGKRYAGGVLYAQFYDNSPYAIVGGVDVVYDNSSDVFGDGTVSYTSRSNTLTLNNATISAGFTLPGAGANVDDTVAAIIAKDTINIELIGENVIESADLTHGVLMVSSLSKMPNVRFTGSGTLTIKSASVAGIESYSTTFDEGPGIDIDVQGVGVSGTKLEAFSNVVIAGSPAMDVAGDTLSLSSKGETFVYAGSDAATAVEKTGSLKGDAYVKVVRSYEIVFVDDFEEHSVIVALGEKLTPPEAPADYDDDGSHHAFRCWTADWYDCVDFENYDVNASVEFYAMYDRTDYDLIVANVPVTAENAADIPLGEGNGTASFDETTSTLTLTDAVIGDAHNFENFGKAFIYSNLEKLNIVLVGENRIVSSLKERNVGIYAMNDVSFAGEGSLAIVNTNVAVDCYGLEMNGGGFDAEGRDNALRVASVNFADGYSPYVVTGYSAQVANLLSDWTEESLSGELFKRYVSISRGYTISFVDEDGTPYVDDQFVKVGDMPVVPVATKPASSEYSYTFINWTLDGVAGVVAASSDAKYVAQFESTDVMYAVAVNANGGSVEGAGYYKYGEVAEITVAALDGYVFAGWADDENAGATREITVTESVELTANFTAQTFMLTYTLDGEQYGEIETYATGASVAARGNPESRVGYTFSGWTGVPSTMPAKDVEVVGSYVPNDYSIFYMVNGVLFGAEESHAYGESIAMREAPVKVGYKFSGWDTTLVTMPANDVYVRGTLTKKSFTITYIVDGDTVGIDTLAYGDKVSMMKDPQNPGYAFSGWNKTILRMPAEDVIVMGTFSSSIYTVEFLSADTVMGVVVGESGEYPYGKELQVAATAALGYHFVKWSDENTESSRTVAVSGDTKLVAVFAANVYAVKLNANGGKVENDITEHVYGSGLTLPEAVRTDYSFEGWFDNKDFKGARINAIAARDTGDMEFFAKWTSVESSSSMDDGKSSSSVGDDDTSSSSEGKNGKSSSSVAKDDKSSSSSAKDGKSSSSEGKDAKSSSSEGKDDSSSGSEGKDVIFAGIGNVNFNVRVDSRMLQIEGAYVGAPVALLDMQGRVVYSGYVQKPAFSIAVPRAGTYVVRIASQMRTVTIR